MKKKIVSLLVALAIFSTSVFAAPVSVAASLPEPAQTVTSNADLDALFADVNAVALTDEEAQAVEGEGSPVAIGAATGAAVGAAVGIYKVATTPYVPKTPSRDTTAGKVAQAAETIVGNMAAYAAAGATAGALIGMGVSPTATKSAAAAITKAASSISKAVSSLKK